MTQMKKPNGDNKSLAKTNGQPPAIPDDVSKMMEEDEGRGVSSEARDNLVPMMKILHDNSPEAKERDAKYVDGAKPGMVFARSLTNPLISAEDEGFLFQPCFTEHCMVEWRPRDAGGGFVQRYDFTDTDKKNKPDNPAAAVADRLKAKPHEKKQIFVLPNGNDLVETRYIDGFLIIDADNYAAYVIPCTGTNLSVARSWNTSANQIRTPRKYDDHGALLSGGTIKPLWATIWRIKTVPRENAQGDWFVYDPKPEAAVVDMSTYLRGRGLAEAFERGEKKADMTEETGDQGGGGDTHVGPKDINEGAQKAGMV